MTSVTWLTSLALFSISLSGTPGPNNVMLTASGAMYGYRRTLPHILGIVTGCIVLFTLVALGLGALFTQYPLIHRSLQFIGATYLLWLAWKIGSAPPPQFAADAHARPLTFLQAAAFQFANPKAWIMGLTLASAFLPDHGPLWLNALGIALIVELFAFPCISFWTAFGMALSRWLKTPRAWRIFNVIMGLLTAACVAFIVID